MGKRPCPLRLFSPHQHCGGCGSYKEGLQGGQSKRKATNPPSGEPTKDRGCPLIRRGIPDLLVGERRKNFSEEEAVAEAGAVPTITRIYFQADSFQCGLPYVLCVS
jgi:hypothetical protein